LNLRSFAWLGSQVQYTEDLKEAPSAAGNAWPALNIAVAGVDGGAGENGHVAGGSVRHTPRQTPRGSPLNSARGLASGGAAAAAAAAAGSNGTGSGNGKQSPARGSPHHSPRQGPVRILHSGNAVGVGTTSSISGSGATPTGLLAVPGSGESPRLQPLSLASRNPGDSPAQAGRTSLRARILDPRDDRDRAAAAAAAATVPGTVSNENSQIRNGAGEGGGGGAGAGTAGSAGDSGSAAVPRGSLSTGPRRSGPPSGSPTSSPQAPQSARVDDFFQLDSARAQRQPEPTVSVAMLALSTDEHAVLSPASNVSG
jgi:hypothetical protein